MADRPSIEAAGSVPEIRTLKLPARKKKPWSARLGVKIRILSLIIYHQLILGRRRWRNVTRNGVRYRLQCEHVGKRIIIHGAFHKEKLDLFIDLARQYSPQVHIDIGAHVGAHLLPVMAAGLAGEYCAIEASRPSFNALLKNIELNGHADRVRTFNTVLSDSEREVVFRRDAILVHSGHGVEDEVPDHSRPPTADKEILPAVPLDSLVSFRKRRISLKIDVEGHELSVLQGAERLLADNQILMQVEIWDHNVAYLNWLFARGFYLIAAVGDDYYLRNFEEGDS